MLIGLVVLNVSHYLSFIKYFDRDIIEKNYFLAIKHEKVVLIACGRNHTILATGFFFNWFKNKRKTQLPIKKMFS